MSNTKIYVNSIIPQEEQRKAEEDHLSAKVNKTP